MKRLLLGALGLLALVSSACLEGDPNPYDKDESSAGNPNAGHTGTAGNVGSGGSSGQLSRARGSQCSLMSSQSVSLTFHNRSQRAVQILWVDFGCKEQLFANLPVGQPFNVSTFNGHVWRLVDVVTGAFVGEYVATATPNQDVDITP